VATEKAEREAAGEGPLVGEAEIGDVALEFAQDAQLLQLEDVPLRGPVAGAGDARDFGEGGEGVLSGVLVGEAEEGFQRAAQAVEVVRPPAPVPEPP